MIAFYTGQYTAHSLVRQENEYEREAAWDSAPCIPAEKPDRITPEARCLQKAAFPLRLEAV